MEVSDGEGQNKPTCETFASVFPGESLALPGALNTLMQELQKHLDMTALMLIQNGSEQYGTLDLVVYENIFCEIKKLPKSQKIALVIESPGGDAASAYQLCRLLQKHCGGYIAVIPRYAKSAATLLALGADEILMGQYAQMGPLDAQIHDPDREQRISALAEVQALEQLNSAAIQAVDAQMLYFTKRSMMKVGTMLPLTMKFVADLLTPLFDKIDAVSYTERSRQLRVAHTYALRLLKPKHSERQATKIADTLVETYPEHGFVIDLEEAQTIGLDVKQLPEEIDNKLDWDGLLSILGIQSFVGLIEPQERPDEIVENVQCTPEDVLGGNDDG